MWSDLLDAILKTFGPMAGAFILLLLVLAYLWRQHDKGKDDRILFLEKALTRAETRSDTLANEGRDFAEKMGESRARDARTLAEVVAVMRDAVADGREERRQYMVILDGQRRDSEDHRKELLEHIEKGNDKVVDALQGLRPDRREYG